MSFVRPEVLAGLKRWRGVIEAAVFLVPGLWMMLVMFGLLRFIGAAVFLFGVALLIPGLRRARFNPKAGDRGVLEVNERQVTWFTADGGDVFSLEDVVRIEIETNDRGPFEDDMLWYFTLSDGRRPEVIGAAAEGDTIFDLLATFDNVNFENVIKASSSTICDRFLIWQKRD